MAKVNAINNAAGELTIDPGASGDSEIEFSLPPTPTATWSIGVDDTDGDAFKISQGAALGTNDTFSMSAAGELIKPLQPAFYGVIGTDDDDVTGDGTNFTVGSVQAFTEIYDQNSDFNVNGTFTAPVTGTYQFAYTIYFGPMTSDQTGCIATFSASNHDIEFGYFNPYVGRYNPATDDNFGLSSSCYVQMDAADIMNFELDVSTTGKTVDIISGSDDVTVVSGFLVV